MTATERVRELLDERGVEWDYGITGATTTRFNVNGVDLTFTPMRDGLVCSTIMTPEQAIAATLGDAPRLPHWWTHDGTLHVELPKLPDSISVRLPDQRDREVGSARTWQYTRDSGTCHDKNGFDPDTGFECTVCGTMVDSYMITPADMGHEEQFHYCPFCGRVVDA